MNNEQQILTAIDLTLQSLDGMEKADPKPFLLTRIQYRLNQSPSDAWTRWAQLISRPSIWMGILAAVVSFNVWTMVHNTDTASADNGLGVVEEYNPTEASFANLETLEP